MRGVGWGGGDGRRAGRACRHSLSAAAGAAADGWTNAPKIVGIQLLVFNCFSCPHLFMVQTAGQTLPRRRGREAGPLQKRLMASVLVRARSWRCVRCVVCAEVEVEIEMGVCLIGRGGGHPGRGCGPSRALRHAL